MRRKRRERERQRETERERERETGREKTYRVQKKNKINEVTFFKASILLMLLFD